ncbi:hypothetical protein HDU76_011288, partial [Blyttiomyces sp. JEL0837]
PLSSRLNLNISTKPGSIEGASLKNNAKSSNITLNTDKGRYFTVAATVDTLSGKQNFSLLVDINNCYSFIRSTLCSSPSDSYSCNGPK